MRLLIGLDTQPKYIQIPRSALVQRPTHRNFVSEASKISE